MVKSEIVRIKSCIRGKYSTRYVCYKFLALNCANKNKRVSLNAVKMICKKDVSNWEIKLLLSKKSIRFNQVL